MSLPVLHRDAAVLVVGKPSGIPVHRGWAEDRVTVVSLARELAGGPVHPVHRLDRATSGALVLALSPEVARELQAAMGDGRLSRRYLALTRGIPAESGTIDYPLRTEPDGTERKPATSEFRRLHVFRNRYSLVEVRPRTGRYHQVRRHLKSISCHVIGDVLYGKGEHNRLFRAEYGLHRLALHAADVRWPDPLTGEPRLVRAPLPEDLAGPFGAIGIPRELWD